MEQPQGGGAVRMQGFLLKSNREYRKANILGKWKRRWVQLTSTLVYAQGPDDVAAGRLQVFSMRECSAVRQEGDIKFTVRFPERSLNFKVDGADAAAQCQAWVAALEAARGAHRPGTTGASSKGSTQLDTLKRAAEESLVQQASTASGSSATGTPRSAHATGPAYALVSPSGGMGGMAMGGLGGLPRVTGGSMASSGGDAGASVSRGHTWQDDRQPPSPRSMLANAQVGAAFVAVGAGGWGGSGRPSAGAAGSWRGAGPRGSFAGSGGSDIIDGSGSDGEQLEEGGGRADGYGSSAGSEPGVAADDGAASSTGGGGSSGTERGPSQRQFAGEVAASPQEGGSRRVPESHAPVARRVTPGVMLVDPAASLAGPASAGSPGAGGGATGGAGAAVVPVHAVSPLAMAAAAAAAPGGDEVLRLQPSQPDSKPHRPPSAKQQAQQQPWQQQLEDAGGGDEVLLLDPLEISPKPLKPAIKGGGNGGGLSPGGGGGGSARGTSSGSPAKAGAGSQQPAAAAVAGDAPLQWLEEDWDAPDEQAGTSKVAAAARPPPAGCTLGAATAAAAGGDAQAVASINLAAAGGVRADKDWLEEDWDAE